jgi:hypothetical protein
MTKKQLIDEPWPEDKKWRWRAVDRCGEIVYYIDNPTLSEQEEEWVGTANWTDSLEERTNWIKESDYKKLPNGVWLVKVDAKHKPYHVAYVSTNGNGHKFIVVGGHFLFDQKPLIAYKELDCD